MIILTWIAIESVDLKPVFNIKSSAWLLKPICHNKSITTRVLYGVIAVKRLISQKGPCWEIYLLFCCNFYFYFNRTTQLSLPLNGGFFLAEDETYDEAVVALVINLWLWWHKVENSIMQDTHPQNLCKHTVFDLYLCCGFDIYCMRVLGKVELCPNSNLNAYSGF